jgi:hypothetical protein
VRVLQIGFMPLQRGSALTGRAPSSTFRSGLADAALQIHPRYETRPASAEATIHIAMIDNISGPA